MIKYLSHLFNNFSQTLSWFLGSVVVIFFLYMMTTGQNPKVIVDWTLSTLGKLFIIIFLVQLIISIYCLIQVNVLDKPYKRFWFEFGLQVSSSISTVALTFTLFGISVGIGELSSSNLDISTINKTIERLTQQFSMAFMTSVIGLPVSSILKSILIINFEHYLINDQTLKLKQIKGE